MRHGDEGTRHRRPSIAGHQCGFDTLPIEAGNLVCAMPGVGGWSGVDMPWIRPHLSRAFGMNRAAGLYETAVRKSAKTDHHGLYEDARGLQRPPALQFVKDRDTRVSARQSVMHA